VIELNTVKHYYGTRCAKRSGVPLMNHITEGLLVLDEINATSLSKRAYCLHPLVQEDSALGVNFEWLREFDPLVVALAMEYRSVANDYLSQMPFRRVEEIRLSPLEEVNNMLRADKVQNYKDFLRHHLGAHPRSERINEYFQQWLDRLRIPPSRFQDFENLLAASASDPVEFLSPPSSG